jgi:dTDP-4-dehydrorhamnose 3,5-epimerase
MGTATDLALLGLLIYEPAVFGDDRGFFYEAWNRRAFAEATGEDPEFVQDNHSRSVAGVLRGIHYQLEPHSQGKLVRAAIGRIWDVAVDLRRSSPTFGQWVGVELSEENHKQLWIPPGFGHGFLVLSEVADVLYKATDYYAPALDRSLRWNDPTLGIDWPVDGAEPVLSAKDAAAPFLEDAEVFP